MQREDVVAKLRAHEADLHQVGVARLYLFGSVARQDARPDSDVDLFFDTDNPRFSLIELVDVQDRVSDILGTETDVMTRPVCIPCCGTGSKQTRCACSDVAAVKINADLRRASRESQVRVRRCTARIVLALIV
jgi:uncharacterized protein